MLHHHWASSNQSSNKKFPKRPPNPEAFFMVSSKIPMKHLIRIRVFLKPYFWQILGTLLILLTLTGLSLLVPRIIRSVIDDGLARGQSGYLIRSALLLLGLGLISAILNLANRYWSEWI